MVLGGVLISIMLMVNSTQWWLEVITQHSHRDTAQISDTVVNGGACCIWLSLWIQVALD